MKQGIRVQLPLHHLHLAGRNTLMAGGLSAVAMDGLLDGPLHIAMGDDRNTVKRLWNRAVKWRQENLR
jgi:hypothetical protein